MTLPDDLLDDVPVEPIVPDEPVEVGGDDEDSDGAEGIPSPSDAHTGGEGNETGPRQAEKNRETDPPA
jgi:hypothetical protein